MTYTEDHNVPLPKEYIKI